ncbi:MAG: glutathione-dependent formaldehyde dehydrogenase [Parachlamydiaceae bacterium]|nr:glutathione-dependent formaldehyde dehydrogenase [Parachlamydiaceae bacterium]
MKALVFHNPKKVSVDIVKDPEIEKDSDVIIKVTSTAICGSDLHIYNGFIPQVKPMVLGHEFMGVITEVGKDVKNFKKDDRVVVPFPIACGNCFFCNHNLTPHCENSNPNYGPEGGTLKQKGGALFGFTDLYGGYNGGQAEFARVPYADFTLRKIDHLKDEEVLFLTDIFPTGWSAIDWADLKGGETVVVFGCGPVGIMAQKAAWLKGAGRVIGVDFLDYRLEIARKSAKSETLNLSNTDVVLAIRDMTQGRGADVCVDAVGMEAKRSIWEKISNNLHMQAGTIEVIKLCASAVRRGGVISVVGVYGSPYSNFPFGQIFDKGVTIKTGQALVHHYIDELLELVKSKKVILDDIITHSLPLDNAAHAYEIFCDKKDNCLKVVLKP